MRRPAAGSLVLFFLAFPTAALAQNLLDFWVPNGPVNATAYDPVHERLYIGGQFDRIGAPSGAGALVDPTSGAVLSPLLRIAPIGAVVRTVVSDGAGGWFIGGDFAFVQGLARQNLARVDATGNLTAWNPGADGSVRALALSSGVLYVGGAFATLGGSARARLGALDPTSGAATAWAPAANDTVESVDVFSNVVYVGGDFTQIGGTTRNHVAALSTAGALTTWNPNADAAVRAVYRGTTNIALGGEFLHVGGTLQSHVALVNATTGAAAPSVISADGPVYAFAADATRLFVGGDFTTIGGASRTGLAAFNLTTNVIDASWDANLDGPVRDLYLSGAQLYLAGGFETVHGVRRGGSARVSAAAATGGVWDPRTGSQTYCVAASATNAFVGGRFMVVNYENSSAAFYHNLAAYDFAPASPTFGRPLPVALDASTPGPGSDVHALSFVDPYLFVGGSFSKLNGLARSSVGRIDVGSWSPGTWAPALNGSVQAMDAVPYAIGDVLVCGSFTSPGFNVAYISDFGGSYPMAAPSTSFAMNSVLRSYLGFYYAGAFDHVGGVARRGFADVSGSTVNSADPFTPDSIASFNLFNIRQLVEATYYVYAGGYFTGYGVFGRKNLLEIDRLTGLPTAWAPNPDNGVWTQGLSGDRLYIGGQFTTVAGQPRPALASFDLAHSGGLSPWNPTVYGLSSTPLSIAAASNRVAVGGDFEGANGFFSPYLAVFDDLTPSLAVGEGPREHAGTRLTVAPNPVAQRAAVSFVLAREATVSLEIVDAQGRIVRRLQRAATMAAGPHQIALDAADLAAGVFVVRLREGTRSTATRWVHVR